VCVGILIRIDHRKYRRYNHAMAHEVGAQKPETQRLQIDVGLFAVSILLLAFSIVSTERLIKDNHLVGVNDILETGQLIPHIVGAFGLLGAVCSLYEGNLTKPLCLTLMGHHFT
jgi:hypothetical protein